MVLKDARRRGRKKQRQRPVFIGSQVQGIIGYNII